MGGKLGAAVARLLAPGGVLVTYGGMSREPLPLPAGALIFRDLVARGFWLTRWVQNNPPALRVRGAPLLRGRRPDPR